MDTLLWVLAGSGICVIIVGAIAVIEEHLYNKKMARGEVPYRLPWSYRLAGWQVGGNPNRETCQDGIFHNRKTGKLVMIWRLSSRAFIGF